MLADLELSRFAPRSRVLLVGACDAGTLDALRERECDVRAYPPSNGRAGPRVFDVALVTEFREAWSHPAELLRDLKELLAPEGRIAVSTLSAGAAAIRIAMYGESRGETTAPTLRAQDVELSAAPALVALLAEAGYRIVPGTERRAWIEGVAAETRDTESKGASQRAGPDEAGQLELAIREIAALRQFFTATHDGQRRLHEELSRLRALLAERDKALFALQSQLDAARAQAALTRERTEALERANHRLAEMEAFVADAEARRARLAAALGELRERSQTSSE